MSEYVIQNSIIANIEEYTEFIFGGYQIQLPYKMGGKESAATIRTKLTTLCGGDGTGMTEQQIQTIATNNPSQCGIDCSGFALRTANESTNHTDTILDFFSDIAYAYNPSFPRYDSAEVRYRWGIGAATLTSSTYCQVITDITDILPGDFIRFDSGDHVAVVKSVVSAPFQGWIRYIIEYAHSSANKGPHEAYIGFTVPSLAALSQMSLTDGHWSDWSTNYSSTIKSLYNYVCRPNCLD